MSIVRLRGEGRPLKWPDIVARRLDTLREMETHRPSKDAPDEEQATWRRAYNQLRASTAKSFAVENGYRWSVQPFALTEIIPGMPRLNGFVHVDPLYTGGGRPAAVVVHTQFMFPIDRVKACVDQIPSWHRRAFSAYVLRPELPL